MTRVVRSHVRFLSDDLMEGRAAGTRGFDLAANYVAAQLERLGFLPAADPATGSYFQRLSFREARLDLESGRFEIGGGAGEAVSLKTVEDVVVRPGANADEVDLTAEAVFVGFGVHAPNFGYDDFVGGIDVRGKIAVVLMGSPSSLPSTARAHFSRRKTAELAARGAVGIVNVQTPAEERRQGWPFLVNSSRFPAMRLVEPDGTLFEGHETVQATATVRRGAASAMFAATPGGLEAVFAASEKNQAQAFSLNVKLRLAARGTSKVTRSHNVLGLLPGTDPALAAEPIVLTAHLDHLGIGPAINGDTLYNGAVDNALGVGVVLAAAEELAKGPAGARPILIAALTAEEKGLLGGYGLARRPPPGVKRYAANINVDMPVILGPFQNLVAYGEVHSTLGTVARSVSGRCGYTISPDPIPDEVVFVRSDQYPFVRAGTPALHFKPGHLTAAPQLDLAALESQFRKTHYHKPSDEMTLGIHWESVGGYARMVTEVVRVVARDPVAPSWLPGDFFGSLYGPDGTERRE